jgi:YbbR domain-containing protein
MKNWIVNNFWIKITSLILAVITWFYVNGELYKTSLAEKESSSEKTKMNKGYITEKK